MISAAKLPFLKRMIWQRLSGRKPACPYCGESESLKHIARKKVVLEVLQCERCLLIFRWPMETAEEFDAFYQQEYKEGTITDLPSPSELAQLCAINFRGGPLDLSGKILMLQALGAGKRLLDYGCSWGYGVRQLRTAEFDAIGYEVSTPRAAYGRRTLGVEILDNPRALRELPPESFDVVFSNHVVEHLPTLGKAFDDFCRLLRHRGMLFLVLPNFNGTTARNGSFLSWIGEAHPVAPTREFFLRNLAAHGFTNARCASGPFTAKAAEQVARGQFDALETEGDELLVAAERV